MELKKKKKLDSKTLEVDFQQSKHKLIATGAKLTKIAVVTFMQVPKHLEKFQKYILVNENDASLSSTRAKNDKSGHGNYIYNSENGKYFIDLSVLTTKDTFLISQQSSQAAQSNNVQCSVKVTNKRQN